MTGKKKMTGLILLLESSMSLYLYTRGRLDIYLEILIPITLLSLFILGITNILRSDMVFAVICVLLLNIGVTMQIMAGKDSMVRLAVIYTISFILGIVALVIMRALEKRVPKEKRRTFWMSATGLCYIILLVFGSRINGTKAWLKFGSFTLQMTEVIKVLSICCLASIFGDSRLSEKRKVLYASFFLLLNGLLLFAVSELGTLVIMVVICFICCLLFLPRIKYFLLFFGMLGGMSAGGIGMSCILNGLYESKRINFLTRCGAAVWGKFFSRLRLLTALDEMDPYGIGYQSLTARKAISLGGWFGSDYPVKVPVGESDYIFASLILNMGVLMAIMVILLFCGLLIRGIAIYMRQRDRYGQILAAGFIYLLFIQSLLTILGSSNFFLLMGMPVAFLSSGGSNLLTVFFMMSYMIYAGRKIDLKEGERICRIET